MAFHGQGQGVVCSVPRPSGCPFSRSFRSPAGPRTLPEAYVLEPFFLTKNNTYFFSNPTHLFKRPYDGGEDGHSVYRITEHTNLCLVQKLNIRNILTTVRSAAHPNALQKHTYKARGSMLAIILSSPVDETVGPLKGHIWKPRSTDQDNPANSSL